MSDLFSNFDRMRREMDELFGDAFERSGVARRSQGFVPPVDVYYEGDPPGAVVKAAMPGVDPDSIGLEVVGRELTITGRRLSPAGGEDRVFQQLEIPHGYLRRVVTLGADVRSEDARATFEHGILRVDLPLVPPETRSRRVPIEVRDDT